MEKQTSGFGVVKILTYTFSIGIVVVLSLIAYALASGDSSNGNFFWRKMNGTWGNERPLYTGKFEPKADIANGGFTLDEDDFYTLLISKIGNKFIDRVTIHENSITVYKDLLKNESDVPLWFGIDLSIMRDVGTGYRLSIERIGLGIIPLPGFITHKLTESLPIDGLSKLLNQATGSGFGEIELHEGEILIRLADKNAFNDGIEKMFGNSVN